MSEPKLVVAGHCTPNSAKLLAIFDPAIGTGSSAHLHYEVDGQTGHISVACQNAPPYSLALFDLAQLPSSLEGSLVHYSIDSEPVRENHGFHRILKLLPDGRPLRIALVSCNGVYRIKDESRRFLLWHALKKEIEAGKVDLMIHAGDQIYADSIVMQQIADSELSRPERISELASKYRKAYIDTWSAPEIASALSRCPSLMMWDDHDIFDGYGSHSDDSSELAQTIFEAAKLAFWEFQAQKNPEKLSNHSFAFGVRIDRTAILALDGRSNRMWTAGHILGNGQLEDVTAWLSSLAQDKPEFLFVVTAVPFLHVPVMSYLKLIELTGGPGGLVEDLRDSWTAVNNLSEGRRALSALFDFQAQSPNTNLVLLSGDVHVATSGSIRSTATQQTIHQIVSSGIGSPPPYGIVRMLLRWASEEKVSLMDGAFTGNLKRLQSPDQEFLLAKRNFAILDLKEKIEVEFFADYSGKVIRFRQPV